MIYCRRTTGLTPKLKPLYNENFEISWMRKKGVREKYGMSPGTSGIAQRIPRLTPKDIPNDSWVIPDYSRVIRDDPWGHPNPLDGHHRTPPWTF